MIEMTMNIEVTPISDIEECPYIVVARMYYNWEVLEQFGNVASAGLAMWEARAKGTYEAVALLRCYEDSPNADLLMYMER